MQFTDHHGARRWKASGGKVAAALQPLYGAERIARFLIGIARKAPAGARSRPVRVNGDPGMRTDAAAGPAGALALERSRNPFTEPLSVHVLICRGARILGRAHHRDIPVGPGNAKMYQHVQRMPAI
jgi:hypothetical protein